MHQPIPEPAERPIYRRRGFWIIAGPVIAAVAAAGIFGLTTHSDSAKTSDLRGWLAEAHKYDDKYNDLGTATYADGNVTVVSSMVWADPEYGSYFLCAWVEPWLRDEGNGGANSQIIVEMGGQVTLRSRGPEESCADASYRGTK